jgi:serine/threonine protein kinase
MLIVFLFFQMCSRWYRPPEVLLGSTSYDQSVDMWSAGCVLAEMLRGEALFPGSCQTDQLFKLFSMLGCPSDLSWPGHGSLPHWQEGVFSQGWVQVRGHF